MNDNRSGSTLKDEGREEDLLKEKVEKIFRERGYKTKMDHTLKSDSGKKYEIDVFAEYEAELHRDKLVIDCKPHGSPPGSDPMIRIEEIVQNTEANKGVLACPSGFTSEAKESAAQKGIELLDESILPQIGVLETDAHLIEKKEDDPGFDMYYSVIGECKRKHLFSLKYPDQPKRDAIKSGFEKNGHPLSGYAEIIKVGGKKAAAVDVDKVYFIEHEIGDDQRYELNVYTYQGIDLDDDVEIELKYRVSNKENRTIEDLCLEGEIISSGNGTLSEVNFHLDPDSDFYDSKSYSDSWDLFSLDISEYGEFLKEGRISDGLKETFEKKGFDVEEDAELLEESGRWWIREDNVRRYLIKRDGKETTIYDSRVEKRLGELHPGDVIDYILQVSLPLRVFIRHYDDLGLKLRLKEGEKTIESRYDDLSSSKRFNKGFVEDLRELEESLDSEAEENGGSEHKNRPGCFIATAVYGNPNAEKIDHLRSFRDEILLEKKVGEFFTDVYYKVSPPIANYISKNESIKKLVGYLIVYPLTDIAEDVLETD